MNDTRIGFFSRMKKAIFKFDEYEKFVVEEPKTAIKYLAKLVLIFSILVTIALFYILAINIKSFINEFDQKTPDFTISNGSLDIKDEASQETQIYFDNFGIQLILNENSKEFIKTDYENCLEVLNNKMILKYKGFMQEIPYEDMEASKQSLVNWFSTQRINVAVFIIVIVFLFTFVLYSLVFLIDTLMLALLGFIINKIIRINFRFKEIFKISIYAMTLPIILYLIYILANILMGITTKYFSIAYNTISYIYLITVLLIMKSDIIKNTQELQSILEEEKKVREELARQKKEEKEKQEEANREKKKEKENKKGKEKPNTEPQTEN